MPDSSHDEKSKKRHFQKRQIIFKHLQKLKNALVQWLKTPLAGQKEGENQILNAIKLPKIGLCSLQAQNDTLFIRLGISQKYFQ